MSDLVAPALTYAFVMTFTPGPNNVSASALGMRYGFRGAFRFICGMASGFFILLFASGLLTDYLTRTYARVAPYLKWIGAAYMVLLAVSLVFEHASGKARSTSLKESYIGGLMLQFVNPKGILYGITIYGSFAVLLTGTLLRTMASAALLAALGFAAVSTWAVVGASVSGFLGRRVYHHIFNVLMALLLVYSAISIVFH